MATLKVTNLSSGLVKSPQASIIKGIDLTFKAGTISVIMGPNGSGKSTLGKTIMGDPGFEISSGQIVLENLQTKDPESTDATTLNLNELDADERSKAGVFLGFQNPKVIPGVSSTQFLRQAISKRRNIEDYSVLEVRMEAAQWKKRLNFTQDFLSRNLNDGFSGGEKKRNELLQMAMLKPEVAILDELDSGLDEKGCEEVANGIKEIFKENPNMALVLITHYQRITKFLDINAAHIIVDGEIVKSGSVEIIDDVKEQGFKQFRKATA